MAFLLFIKRKIVVFKEKYRILERIKKSIIRYQSAINIQAAIIQTIFL